MDHRDWNRVARVLERKNSLGAMPIKQEMYCRMRKEDLRDVQDVQECLIGFYALFSVSLSVSLSLSFSLNL